MRATSGGYCPPCEGRAHQQGIQTKGCGLLKEPEDILLSDVYDTVEPGVGKLNMSLSQNSDTGLFICRCENLLWRSCSRRWTIGVLRGMSLRDVIDRIHKAGGGA